jgi:hypothetical protein
MRCYTMQTANLHPIFLRIRVGSTSTGGFLAKPLNMRCISCKKNEHVLNWCVHVKVQR